MYGRFHEGLSFPKLFETFQKFRKVSTLDHSFTYVIFTRGFISEMPFKVILFHEVTFLAGDSI